jgi:hypothetical protein
MSDSENVRGPEAQPDESETRKPKALPQPSAASEGKPVPKPVRPVSPADGAPRATVVPSAATRDAPAPKPVSRAKPVGRATPVPSKASRDAPVPRPVRRASPARGTPALGKSGTVFGPGFATPRAPNADDAPRSERTSFSTVKKKTNPGMTQAMRTGPGSSRKAEFTRHLIRGQDRVTIRDDIGVLYRFLAPSGPDRYPDTFRGKLVDLSLTGAQVEGLLPDDPPRRELISGAVLVRTKMELPFVEKPLVIDSKVSWVKPTEGEESLIGLKFAGLTQHQTNLIRAFFIGLQSPSRQKFRRGRPQDPA